jgi:hypothetical protein
MWTAEPGVSRNIEWYFYKEFYSLQMLRDDFTDFAMTAEAYC